MNFFVKNGAIFFLVVVFSFITVARANKVSAASLLFDPATGTVAVNAIQSVDIKVDTAGEATSGVDAVITFPSTLFSIDSVTPGTFYQTVVNSQDGGTLTIIGYAETGKTVTGTGVLATVKFKALSAGTATTTFQCTQGQTNDSNINKSGTGAVDILTCSGLVAGSYTITNADGTTATGTPTIVPTVTPATGVTSTIAPTISQLPNTGFFDTVGLMPTLMIGIGMIVIGLLPLFL